MSPQPPPTVFVGTGASSCFDQSGAPWASASKAYTMFCDVATYTTLRGAPPTGRPET
jgi:hypothetical protein